MTQTYDIAIIGGGINGCGVAADAALRGLSVFLCEQDDLAAKTSSSSTKLIHGGLRYLESYDFSMVKKALDERQVLMDAAPHLIHPLALVLPHKKKMRPIWLLYIGLFIYDHLSRKNKLPGTRFISRKKQPFYFSPLNKALLKGFLYYDCATDDARLTITNALQAKKSNASIHTRTKLISAQVQQNHWVLTMQTDEGSTFQVKANVVINATGPWVERVNKTLNLPMANPMALVKGSHIVVPKLYDGQHAYLLQHKDKRVIFVIPYHNNTMIGTTDTAFSGDMNAIKIDNVEENYLLQLVNDYFNQNLQREYILHSWSGVRPLLATDDKNLSSLSRDYAYHFSSQPAPAVTIYGGKITTYRQLAKDVIDALQPIFPTLSACTTNKTFLPGAKTKHMNFLQYQSIAKEKYHWLEPEILSRYLSTYGTITDHILQNCEDKSDLGMNFSAGLYQVEVDYLIEEEWAKCAEDILFRRTKTGLSMQKLYYDKLAEYVSHKLSELTVVNN